MSANDNVKQIKSNIRYVFDKKINKMKFMLAVMASDGPSPHSLSLRLGLPAPSHRDATMPSPCWTSHFMTQERIMFSNPTPSKPHLSECTYNSDTKIHRHRNSEIDRDAETQRYKKDTGTKRHRDTETKRNRDTET